MGYAPICLLVCKVSTWPSKSDTESVFLDLKYIVQSPSCKMSIHLHAILRSSVISHSPVP